MKEGNIMRVPLKSQVALVLGLVSQLIACESVPPPPQVIKLAVSGSVIDELGSPLASFQTSVCTDAFFSSGVVSVCQPVTTDLQGQFTSSLVLSSDSDDAELDGFQCYLMQDNRQIPGQLNVDVSNLPTQIAKTGSGQVVVSFLLGVCKDGTCPCRPGTTDCSGSCRDLTTDNANCGACAAACVDGLVCTNSTCGLSCQEGLVNCSGTCRDLATDNANCGTCGTACEAGQVCSDSTCALSCQAGLTNCSGTCRDLTTDRASCGACGKTCAAGQICSASKCALSCQAGLTNCSGTCTNLKTDNYNCGSCGKVCAAGLICSKEACTCLMGQTSCSGVCADLTTDRANCG
ncbi:hypothetical protein BVG81_007770, partial [Haliangium sp. UPWRP_2]